MTQKEYEEGWRTILPLCFHRKDQWIQRIMDGLLIRGRAELEVAAYMFGNVLPDYDVRKQLAGVDVETLIVSGRHDWVTPVGQPRAIHELLPNARIVLHEDSGHFPFI